MSARDAINDFVQAYSGPLPASSPVTFTPHTTARGGVRWTGHYTAGTPASGTTYVMVGRSLGGHRRETSSGQIEVVQDRDRGGWKLIVNGQLHSRFTRKTDAQIDAELLVGAR